MGFAHTIVANCIVRFFINTLEKNDGISHSDKKILISLKILGNMQIFHQNVLMIFLNADVVQGMKAVHLVYYY